MKHAYTQQELAAFHDEGRTVLANYRTAGTIAWSHGSQEWIVRPFTRKVSGLPLTRRGRTQAVTPTEFSEMLKLA